MRMAPALAPIVCATQRRCHATIRTRARDPRAQSPVAATARAVGRHRLLCSICSNVYDCSGRIAYAVALGAVSIFFCLALLILAKVNNSVDGQIFKARLSSVPQSSRRRCSHATHRTRAMQPTRTCHKMRTAVLCTVHVLYDACRATCPLGMPAARTRR